MTHQGEKHCFVIGPIGKPDSEFRIHADWLLEEIIKPTFERFPDFDIERSDKSANPGMIDSEIIRKLRDADLVIADLSFLNANVFYEIGIRHMFQKPIIHMQLSEGEIPFDVSLYRAIKFSLRQPSDLQKAKQELQQSVEAVLSLDYRLDNPITRAIGQINFRESATPQEGVLLEKISALEQRVSRIEPKDLPQAEEASGELLRITVKFDPANTAPGEVFAAVNRAMSAFMYMKPTFGKDYLTLAYPGLKPEPQWQGLIEKELKALPGILELTQE